MEVRDPSGGGGTARVDPAEGRSVSMPGARTVTIQVAADRTGGAYSLFEVEVGAGGGEGPHVQHREDEFLYVIEGRFGFVVEGVETESGPGANLYVPKGALHAYENVGDGKGRLLAVHTPGGPQERFIERVRGPTTGPDGFALLAAEHGIEMCETKKSTERSF